MSKKDKFRPRQSTCLVICGVLGWIVLLMGLAVVLRAKKSVEVEVVPASGTTGVGKVGGTVLVSSAGVRLGVMRGMGGVGVVGWGLWILLG